MRKLHIGADLRDMKSGVFKLSASGMHDFVVQTQHALDQTASLDSLRALSAMETDDPLDTAKSKAHLFSAFHVLRKRGFGVFGLSPATAEALSTIVGLPAVACLILRTTSGKADQIQSEQELWGNDLHALPVPPADILLHVVSSVSRGEGGYVLSTLDGPSWSALPDERVEGEILPAASEISKAKYYQVVGHFVVTPLSEFELEGHIEERYSVLPYRFREPKVMRIR